MFQKLKRAVGMHEIQTIDAALQQFIKRGVSPRTAQIDIYRIGPLCEEFKGKKIVRVNSANIDDYISQIELRMAPTSVNSYKQTIKAFFNWCVRHEDVNLSKSPAAHLRIKKRYSSRHKAANEADLQKVIRLLTEQITSKSKPKIVRDLLAFMLAYDSGNRRKELATLRTRTLDSALKKPYLTTGGVVVYVAISDEGKKGSVPLRFTEHTAAVYRLWKSIRPWHSRNYVFIALGGSKPGNPLTLDGFTSIFVKRCTEFGVPIYRTHSFRHLKGTKTTDEFTPHVTADMLSITLETAMLHYYSHTAQKTIDATSK